MKKKLKRYIAAMTKENDGVFKADIVDRPAIEQASFYFNEQKEIKLTMDERGIITGPALIPDKPIYRRQKIDGVEEEFEIVFPAEVVEAAMMKFMRDVNKSMVGVMHSSDKPVKDVYVIECFMVDEQRGIMAPKGFDVPDRTWFLSGKVDNPQVQEKLRNGELTGWSIEGLFSFYEDQHATDLASQIDSILRK